LKQNFHTYTDLQDIALPFSFLGGYIGYIGYEMKEECFDELYQNGTARSRIQSTDRSSGDMPDVLMIYIDRFLAFDHQNMSVFFVFQGLDLNAGKSWISEMKEQYNWLVREKNPSREPASFSKNHHDSCFQPNHVQSQYIQNVKTCFAHIRSGDSYELCLTTQAHLKKRIMDPDRTWGLYRNLRRSSPAPFAAYLRLGNYGTILSSSPERFFKIASGGEMECKPIKGTRKRDPEPDKDQMVVQSLSTSLKDRAENLMASRDDGIFTFVY
jgi:para-aminobenzoate synthetase